MTSVFLFLLALFCSTSRRSSTQPSQVNDSSQSEQRTNLPHYMTATTKASLACRSDIRSKREKNEEEVSGVIGRRVSVMLLLLLLLGFIRHSLRIREGSQNMMMFRVQSFFESHAFARGHLLFCVCTSVCLTYMCVA